MEYKKFIINKYKSISKPLEIDIGNNALIPIIGINECGKTTILNAIFAFDFHNDKLNDGKHLKDIHNLYKTERLAPSVSAEIEITWDEFRKILNKITLNDNNKKSIISYRRMRKRFPDTITVTRDLDKKKYDIEGSLFKNSNLNNDISSGIINSMPYILYFDDFVDSVTEKIEIKKDEDGQVSGWLAIFEKLFTSTNSNFSVFKLNGMDERQRKSVISRVVTKLNKTLTDEWKTLRLEDTGSLEISIDYIEESNNGNNQEFIKLDLVETDVDMNKHYFFIRDRSKGFFWFFNFVMKLEFNPKTISHKKYDAIYLLDEPGSYLHTSAQMKLCEKLKRISERNRVLYCTHSHYLLNPKIIPFNKIKIAEKGSDGNICLRPIYDYRGKNKTKTAFQPILDALRLNPYIFDMSIDNILITEGMVDYYSFEMLKGKKKINVLPSTGADSIRYLISLMLSLGCNFYALWDNDKAGITARNVAEKHFGKEVSDKRFFLLPLRNNAKKQILQDLYTGDDLKMIREELNITKSASFDKTIACLFYSPKKQSIINNLSNRTRDNFRDVLESLGL